MKCKNCGGELLFENGIGSCQSCGSTFSLDNIYENVDVYLCYEENDGAGRRTRDSIIAQEIYRKLEENKITTFYERVSADGMIGGDLEASKLAAIHKAKIIIVLGTLAESFTTLETKYGEYFTGKPVVPFCVDVNPGAIPKTLSKIQAMSYSTIGWDKDLIKGICNILGRVPDVDTVSLYGRRKRTVFIFTVIMAVVIVFASVIAWIYLKPSETVEAPDTLPPQETAELTEKPLTQSEIYEEAQALLNSGKYLEAANEFNKIVEYKDSSNQIKKIYDRYDGYYQDAEQIYSLYLNIVDGKMAEVSFEKAIGYRIVKVEESASLENNQITIKYVDNLTNEGALSVTLCNEQVEVAVSTTSVSGKLSIGDTNVVFLFTSKTDRPPIKEVTKELLLDWVTNPISPEDITAYGFELEYIDTSGEYNESFGAQYRIANTDVVIISTNVDLSKYDSKGHSGDVPQLEETVVIAAIAPVNLLCPEKIGSSSCVFTENNIAYVPTAYDIMGPQVDRYWSDNPLVFMVDGEMTHYTYWQIKMSTLKIKEDSKVGIISNKFVGEKNYQYLIETHKDWYLASKG